MTELVSIGDKVAEGRYSVHSHFTRAVNFVDGKRWAFLVAEEIGPGPLNIVVRGLPCEPLEPLVVSARGVRLAELRLPYAQEQVYPSRLELPRADLEGLDRRLAALERRVLRSAAPESLAFLLDEARLKKLRPGFETSFARKIRQGTELVFQGDLRAGVRALRGCGFGLTPSGDDFLAGLMYACHVSAALSSAPLPPGAAAPGRRAPELRRSLEVIHEELRGCDSFSTVFLSLAFEGRFFGKLKDVALALAEGAEARVEEAADRLLSIGATSGADLATGLIMTLRRLDSMDRAAPPRA